MNFGGAHGEKLEKLTRIVVHMGDPKAAFLGVAFDYDGDVSLFGRQGETELSFLIDGPKGERISEVTTTQAPNSMGIRSLHVCFFFEILSLETTREANIFNFRFAQASRTASCSSPMSFNRFVSET